MSLSRCRSPLLLAAISLFFFCFPLAGCQSAPSPSGTDSRDQVIGRPPPPELDDPFFASALPAEAIPAEPSGRIVAPRRDTPSPPRDLDPEPEPEPVSISEPRPTPPTPPVVIPDPIVEPEPQPEPTAPPMIAAPSAPDPPLEVEPEELPPPPHRGNACFSCVRICPVDHRGRAQCSDDADDLICGWGTHENIEEARRTATAHCDATLEMARQTPIYSRIGGQCPPARCR